MDIFGLTSTEQAALAGGMAGSIFISLTIFVIFWYILLVIAGWKIFKKAGEPGWKSIIPIYNFYMLYKIVDMQGWWWGMVGLSILYSVVAAGAGYGPSLTPEQVAAIEFGAHPLFIIVLRAFAAISIYVSIAYAYRTAKVFGHGIGYTIGLIFLPNIFWLILGFGKSKYNKKALKK